jgi:hypothetical protein
MTIASTDAAVSRIQRPRLWGIARYVAGTRAEHFEISWDDIERDTDWATGLLADYGIGAHRYVIVVSLTPLAPWSRPFELALRRLGAVICPTDAYRFDARRTSMFARGRPSPTMVLGLEDEVTAGLDDLDGGLSAQIGAMPSVLARPSTHARLAAAGIDPYCFTPLGAATAVECHARGGVHVNSAEWAVESIDGELHLTTVADRAHRLDGAPTGARGRVEQGTCACGRTDVRVVFETVDAGSEEGR